MAHSVLSFACRGRDRRTRVVRRSGAWPARSSPSPGPDKSLQTAPPSFLAWHKLRDADRQCRKVGGNRRIVGRPRAGSARPVGQFSLPRPFRTLCRERCGHPGRPRALSERSLSMRKPHPLPLLAVAALTVLTAFPALSMAATGAAGATGGLSAPADNNIMAQLRSLLSIYLPRLGRVASPTGAFNGEHGAGQSARRPARPAVGCEPDPNGSARCGSQVIILPPQHGVQP